MLQKLVIPVFFCLLYILLFSNVLAQNNDSDNISDCFGAVDLPTKGSFKIAFTNNPGVYDDVFKYKKILNYNETNSIWMHFKAPYDGAFSLYISNDKFEVEALLFKGNETLCKTILNGDAQPLQHIQPNTLLTDIDTIKLKKGEHLYIFFNSTQKQVNQLLINTDFSPNNIYESIEQLKTEVDRRTDQTQPYLRIGIRGGENKLPVDARIIISDSKSFDAMYQGTDILLPNDKGLKFNVKIDAVGYFFYDQEIKTAGNKTEEIIITLEPLIAGKKMELQGIQFIPQTSDFTVDAEIQLKRVRDFLALNSDLSVEIQGHVFRLGNNNFFTKRLSRKRAKKVMKYLIKSGINKSRLTAVGYGNLHMLYPEPTSKYEEQANRRVEIKIL